MDYRYARHLTNTLLFAVVAVVVLVADRIVENARLRGENRS